MDAFAASITCGINIHRIQISSGNHSHKSEMIQWLIVAGCFGFFQAIMPVAGWFLGSTAKGWIEPVDHWVAFTLLALVGGHMIIGAIKDDDSDEEPSLVNPMAIGLLLFLGITTSIDALAVGVSLAALQVEIWQPAVIIGVVTAFLSLVGAWIGDRLGHFFENKFELIGGCILIFIGLKILVSHML